MVINMYNLTVNIFFMHFCKHILFHDLKMLKKNTPVFCFNKVVM